MSHFASLRPPPTKGDARTSRCVRNCIIGRVLASPLGMPDLLKWTLIFFILALIAGVLGFGGIAGAAAGIAKILFFGFVIFAAVMLVLNLMNKSTR